MWVWFFCLFFKSFGLGRAFFFFSFVFWYFFFSAVIGCQHNLHQLEIRNQKKKKPQQQQKKNQKAKTDLKPNSSEVHSYLLAGNQARSQGQKCGHSGATGTPHNQETRTRSATQPAAPHWAHSEEWQHGGTLPTAYTFIVHFLVSSEDRTSVSHFWLNRDIDFKNNSF